MIFVRKIILSKKDNGLTDIVVLAGIFTGKPYRTMNDAFAVTFPYGSFMLFFILYCFKGIDILF